MADEVDIRISLDLDPNAVMGSIEDYDDDTAPYLDPAKRVFEETHSALGAIHDAKAAAATDPRLNEYGALLKVDDYARKRFEKIFPMWDAVLSSLTSKAEAWEKEMSKAVEQKASQMVSGEIRAHFKSLDNGARMVAIRQAIRDGDEVVATAVLGAPAMLSGLSPEMQAVHLREWHERSDPAMAKRLRAVTQMRDAVSERSASLHRERDKAVGTIKIEGKNFDRHGKYDAELTPAQVRAMAEKSDAPFRVTGV